jgi:hypothetical protein
VFVDVLGVPVNTDQAQNILVLQFGHQRNLSLLSKDRKKNFSKKEERKEREQTKKNANHLFFRVIVERKFVLLQNLESHLFLGFFVDTELDTEEKKNENQNKETRKNSNRKRGGSKSNLEKTNEIELSKV